MDREQKLQQSLETLVQTLEPSIHYTGVAITLSLEDRNAIRKAVKEAKEVISATDDEQDPLHFQVIFTRSQAARIYEITKNRVTKDTPLNDVLFDLIETGYLY